MNLDPELVHKLFAMVLLVVVLPPLLHAMEVLRGRSPRFMIPAALLLFGAMLFLDPWLFHGGDFGAEGMQHQVQGVVLATTGVVEWLRARGRLQGRLWAALLPLTIVAVGMLFVLHTQHGGHGPSVACQLVQHRFLGATLIGAGLVKLLASFGWSRGNWADVGWLLFLALAGVQLLLYSESLPSAGATPAAHLHGGEAP